MRACNSADLCQSNKAQSSSIHTSCLEKSVQLFAQSIIKTPVNDFNQVGIVKPLAY